MKTTTAWIEVNGKMLFARQDAPRGKREAGRIAG